MNVQQEDRQKNSTSRGVGLGVAAAAIGVGVGAALYYFFSKTPEQPHGEGSAGATWNCEETFANETAEERQRNFRKRSWSLEECSICFEIILKDHKVMTLPCTHHFHEQCIVPWLQEQQTCPNCRKAI